MKHAPIPLDEALPIARQIAEALEAAHEQGIIHRDLKPANVKVRPDGTVKVLDFGLAKALEPDLSDTEAANSPTMTMTAAATKMGVIMGTAAYMSPEQARGKTVDKRADIWAFGVVPYEMLTGKQAFTGEDISLTLSQVLQTEPDWSALPENVPLSVDRYLRRCLQKDPKQRIRDIGDVRLALDGAFETGVQATGASAVPDASRSAGPSLAFVAAGVALTAALIAGLAVWSLTRPDPASPTRFVLTAPPGVELGTNAPLVSPDGRTVAFQGIRDGPVPDVRAATRPARRGAGARHRGRASGGLLTG